MCERILEDRSLGCHAEYVAKCMIHKINKNYIYLYSVEGDLFLDIDSLGYSKYANSLLEKNI